MRLFANEKRTELLKIKVKPSVLKKAIEAWYVCYPNSEEPNFDDMFQEMILEVAKSKNLIGVNDLPEEFKNMLAENTSVPTVVTNLQNSDIVEDESLYSVNSLLKG